jgi:hypothetical protein
MMDSQGMRKAKKDSILWTPREIMRIALAADCDPKTVARFLDGERPLRPSTKVRIVAALKARSVKP